jgi:repressor LexA
MPDARTLTTKQGQYVALIYYYTKIHGMPPAEADFRVTPPVVHEVIKTLHARGFIEREPGQARSIRLSYASAMRRSLRTVALPGKCLQARGFASRARGGLSEL